MKKLIAANWKMNKNSAEAAYFMEELKQLISNDIEADVVICPPFTLLHEIRALANKTKIKLGAQNMFCEDAGAFTGEISPLMLRDSGCEYVILGHSERRELFGEQDPLVNKKVVSALKHALIPILCIGENMKQREQGKTKEILKSQLANCLKDISKEYITRINIAYEPTWAISKGNPNHKAATAQDAEEGHKFIREVIATLYDKSISKKMRIIYGGSMKPENTEELLSMPDIDGGLVGNASLNAKSFAEIIKFAHH